MTLKENIQHSQKALQRQPQNRWFYVMLFVGATAVFALMFWGIKESSVYFYTPKEAYAEAQNLQGETIRVGGMVEVGTVIKQADNLKVNFILGDLDSAKLSITYYGALPDMFREGQGVVVEGTIQPSTNHEHPTIQAQKLMVKHSEEYSLPDHPHSINSELLQKSLLKNEYEN